MIMKVLHWISGVVVSLLLMVVLLITSFEIAAYSNYNYYQKEYEKYNVLADVNMEMQDVMYVTEEMMAYLRGNRENLDVYTTVAGEERDFFNQREKDHMADVQELFLGGIALRWIAIVGVALFLAVLIATKGDWKKILPRSYQIATAVLVVLTGGLALLISTDFTKYFTIFHEIFFTNDLWLLNPATDLLINILPEGFFIDMGIRIAVIFVSGLLILLGASFGVPYIIKKKIN